MSVPKNPKMSDIARMLGMSESTVSRALADSPLVAEATRERVRELAARWNYQLNVSARNLRLQRSGTIRLIIPTLAEAEQRISDPFFLDLLGAVADRTYSAGYDLLISKTPPWTNHHDTAMLAQRADGTIIVGQGTWRRQLSELAERDHPLVVWGGHFADDSYLTVGCDNHQGGLLATQHLLKTGRHYIAFAGNPDMPEIGQRFEGYRTAMDAANLGDRIDLTNARFTRDHAYAAIAERLAAPMRPDALVAASDVIAISAIAACRDHALRVPEDIAVVGFDDIAGARWTSPPLTTVRQGIAEGGARLVDILLARMRGDAVSSQILTPQLIVRQSCGAGLPMKD